MIFKPQGLYFISKIVIEVIDKKTLFYLKNKRNRNIYNHSLF